MPNPVEEKFYHFHMPVRHGLHERCMAVVNFGVGSYIFAPQQQASHFLYAHSLRPRIAESAAMYL